MNLHYLLLTVDTICLEVQFVIKNSFIAAIEIYICMTSMMMIDTSGHSWKLLDTMGKLYF